MPCIVEELQMRQLRYIVPCVAVLFAASPTLAGTVVHVSLLDKGSKSDMAGSMHLGMGMGADMGMATMSVQIDQATVPAGEVTFDVVNNSKEMIHEMLVAPVKDQATPLPFVEKENRIDEEAAGHLGEVSELDPGKGGKLTLTMKPGNYVLFCNIPGHYMAGMWVSLEVK